MRPGVCIYTAKGSVHCGERGTAPRRKEIAWGEGGWGGVVPDSEARTGYPRFALIGSWSERGPGM